MRKGSDLIGLPIVAFDTGSRMDAVEDVVFDHDSNRVLGVIVDDGGWLRSARVVPFGDLQAVGPDALIVGSAAAVRGRDDAHEIRPVFEGGNVLKGTRIMTTDGRDLGTMTDIFFDERSGALEGYEVSGGMFADAYTGRSFVPAPKTVKIGHDVAFVEPEVLELMQEQVGGLKGAAEGAAAAARENGSDAAAAVRDAAASAAHAVRSAADEASTRTSAWTEAASERFGAKLAQQSVEQALGRRLRATVATRNRIIIGAAGQIVTEPVAERARAFGMESALLEAAGLAPAQAARAEARDRFETTRAHAENRNAEVRERLREGGMQARDGAAHIAGRVIDAWQRAKVRLESRQQELVHERELRRIRDAVGLPVTRVILDRHDHVILNTGELITNEAVERARDSGVLSVLLDAARHPKAEFSKEAFRAPEPGEASLERQHGVRPVNAP
jgi:uncharacterized protein YrrD